MYSRYWLAAFLLLQISCKTTSLSSTRSLGSPGSMLRYNEINTKLKSIFFDETELSQLSFDLASEIDRQNADVLSSLMGSLVEREGQVSVVNVEPNALSLVVFQVMVTEFLKQLVDECGAGNKKFWHAKLKLFVREFLQLACEGALPSEEIARGIWIIVYGDERLLDSKEFKEYFTAYRQVYDQDLGADSILDGFRVALMHPNFLLH